MSMVLPATALLLIAQLPPPNIIGLFQADEFSFTGGRYQEQAFPYRLFIPRNCDPQQKYPLILWLHGTGRQELDHENNHNTGQLMHVQTLLESPEDATKLGYFLLIPHRPADRAWFDSKDQSDPDSDEIITVVVQMIEDVIKRHPIDPNRISMIGLSSGASAAWEMAMRYPDRFSAIAPVSGMFQDVSRANHLLDTSIWMFNVQDDWQTPVRNSHIMYEAVNQVGGTCYFTEFTGSTEHDAWSSAIRDFDALDWLASQQRGVSAKPSIHYSRYAKWKTPTPVKVSRFSWRRHGLPLGLFAVVLIAVVTGIRMRSKR